MKNLALYFKLWGVEAKSRTPKGFAKSPFSLPYLPSYIYHEEGDSTLLNFFYH